MAPVWGFPSTASLEGFFGFFLANVERLLPFGMKGQLGLGATGSWSLLHLFPLSPGLQGSPRGKAEESLYVG